MPSSYASIITALISISVLGTSAVRPAVREHILAGPEGKEASPSDISSGHLVHSRGVKHTSRMFDRPVEAESFAAAASLLSIFATKADGPTNPTDPCNARSRAGISFVRFPRAHPVSAICEEYERVGPIEKTPEIALKYFKFIGAHDQDPLAVVGNAQFYKLLSFDVAFQEKVGKAILPGVHVTFAEVISACFSTVTNLLRGGAVRDVIVGRRPVDLDLDWDTDTGIIVECMRTKFGLEEIEYQADRQYAKFGKKSNETDLDPLEGFNVEPSGGDCGWENSPNSLLYDVTNGVIIDPTGYGIHDTCRSQFRIPPECNSPTKWMNFETTRYRKYAGLRYAKMMVKGFGWADPDTDIPFLASALHAQVRAEGAGLRHSSHGDLVAQYYAKFAPADRELLLAAHRETLFQMMDALCQEAKDVQTVVERETDVHGTSAETNLAEQRKAEKKKWREERRELDRINRQKTIDEANEWARKKFQERLEREGVESLEGDGEEFDGPWPEDVNDGGRGKTEGKPKITIGETVPLEGVQELNDETLGNID